MNFCLEVFSPISYISVKLFSGISKLAKPSPGASFSRCLTLLLPKPSKISSLSVREQAACVSLPPRSLCRTRALVSTELFRNSCARVEISRMATVLVARAFMEKSLPTKPVVLLYLTMSSTCCRWPTPAPTPMEASFSSPQCLLLT